MTAVDISAAALAVARGNATRLARRRTSSRATGSTACRSRRFDLIVANPPYVAAGDPHLAKATCASNRACLDRSADGLDAFRRIVAHAPSWLVPGGWLFLEHGYDQAAAVRALLATAGFVDIEQHRDLAGIVRASGGRRPAGCA